MRYILYFALLFSLGCESRVVKEAVLGPTYKVLYVTNQDNNKEFEAVEFDKLYIKLDCDWPNNYTWLFSKPCSNLQGIGEDSYTDDYGKKRYRKVFAINVSYTTVYELIYFRQNTLDNFAEPKDIIDRFKIKVNVK